jgi:hypothetical protein
MLQSARHLYHRHNQEKEEFTACVQAAGSALALDQFDTVLNLTTQLHKENIVLTADCFADYLHLALLDLYQGMYA